MLTFEGIALQMVTSNGAVTSVPVSFCCYDKYQDQRHEEEKVCLTLKDHIPSLREIREELKQIHEGILLAGP